MAKFSVEDRAAAVVRATSGGETKRQVAGDVGVSETTLYRWIAAERDRPAPVTRLRAVSSEEAPARRRPLSLAEAIEGGDYLEILLAQQRDIAQSLPDANGPAKAALHRQFSLVTKEIESIRASDTDEDDIGKAAATVDEAWDASAI